MTGLIDRSHDDRYVRACNGPLKGILHWRELDAVWAQLQRLGDDGWYVYSVGEAPPTKPVQREVFERFLVGIRRRLCSEHKEDYCGIVYVDDYDAPTFVKIYDPGKLGMVCGSSAVPPLPGWTLSRCAPVDLERAFPRPRGRRRWWRMITG